MTEAKLIARSRGVPALKIVNTPYNIQLMSTSEIEAVADKVCDDVARALTEPVAEEISGRQGRGRDGR